METNTRFFETTHPSDLDFIRQNVPCQWACPARTNVPAYILAGYRNDYGRSYAINRAANLFPGVLGRICSRPCEAACRHGEPDLGEPVAICALKRAAADRRPRDHAVSERLFAATGKTVAVVGAGPGGLAVAHDLAAFGHRVTVYEAMPRPGGMLVYGIPEFRLPRHVVDEEVFNILRLGVQVIYGVRLGRDVSLADLLSRHDAVVVAAGCYSPRPLGIPGDGLPGVITGLQFMMEVNEGRPPEVGRRVLVIGGGFTAMDCARSALRLGAAEVSVHLRTTEDELYVTREEVIETKREGVRFESLRSAVEVLGDGRVEAVRFRRNRLGTQRGGTRKVGIQIEGSEFTVPADTVIAAIGQSADPSLVQVDGGATVRFDRVTGASEVPGLYGAGDFVTGASTVIEAIGQARRVATAVDAHLMGRERRRTVVTVEPAEDTHRKRSFDFLPRNHLPLLDVPARLADATAEVEAGLSDEAAAAEARRCYLCDLKYEVRVRDCIQCRWCIDVCPRDCIHLASEVVAGRITRTARWDQVAGVVIDSSRCIRCGNCLRVCPTRCIFVSRTRLEDRLVEVR